MYVEKCEVRCDCGHTYESDRSVNWCPKCGQKIFETDKERNASKINKYYMFTVIGLALSALAFFFFKMIIIPVLAM